MNMCVHVFAYLLFSVPFIMLWIYTQHGHGSQSCQEDGGMVLAAGASAVCAAVSVGTAQLSLWQEPPGGLRREDAAWSQKALVTNSI